MSNSTKWNPWIGFWILVEIALLLAAAVALS